MRRPDPAAPPPHGEDLRGQLDLEVLPHPNLARQPPPRARFLPIDVDRLGRKERTGTALDAHPAHPARALAAARGREEDARLGEEREQRVAGHRLDVVLSASVHHDPHRPGRHQEPARDQHGRDEQQHHQRVGRDGYQDARRAGSHRRIPEKIMNAIDMSPTTMNVMPRPRSGAGGWLYRSRSRMAARVTIASAHPTPDPSPYTALSAKV